MDSWFQVQKGPLEPSTLSYVGLVFRLIIVNNNNLSSTNEPCNSTPKLRDQIIQKCCALPPEVECSRDVCHFEHGEPLDLIDHHFLLRG